MRVLRMITSNPTNVSRYGYGTEMDSESESATGGISVTAGDQSGLPDQDTLDVLTGYSLLRTDRNGRIELTTDGRQMWTVTQK